MSGEEIRELVRDLSPGFTVISVEPEGSKYTRLVIGWNWARWTDGPVAFAMHDKDGQAATPEDFVRYEGEILDRAIDEAKELVRQAETSLENLRSARARLSTSTVV